MHCEIPIVTTKVTGIMDLIHHEQNGLLVPPANAEVLAQAIERLYRDQELGQALARSAKRDASNYSPDVITKRHIRMYKTALKPDNRTGRRFNHETLSKSHCNET